VHAFVPLHLWSVLLDKIGMDVDVHQFAYLQYVYTVRYWLDVPVYVQALLWCVLLVYSGMDVDAQDAILRPVLLIKPGENADVNLLFAL